MQKIQNPPLAKNPSLEPSDAARGLTHAIFGPADSGPVINNPHLAVTPGSGPAIINPAPEAGYSEPELSNPSLDLVDSESVVSNTVPEYEVAGHAASPDLGKDKSRRRK